MKKFAGKVKNRRNAKNNGVKSLSAVAARLIPTAYVPA
jgi:hypothetical protein